KGILPPVQSVHAAFADLHSHHMGLLAGARAAVRASLEKLSPQAVEARLDINGPVRMNRTANLWRTFTRMYQSLHDDHDGFAALFLQDFARAYQVQGRTLNPRIERQKGEK
ncbi:MAG: type VI secretion system-associated FHA domain protein TagH, partial [Betaproteobacteria bacterium]|nr:type VI secretion system-associated FHA domain protein TagH [Betaproteobacteria bacterium]